MACTKHQGTSVAALNTDTTAWDEADAARFDYMGRTTGYLDVGHEGGPISTVSCCSQRTDV